VASSFGLIAIFLRHSPDSQLFQEETFESLRDFLNDFDLSVLSHEQADGALTRVDVILTPVVKATPNRWLEMPLPSSVVSSQHVDEDTGCFLLTRQEATRKR